MNRRMFELLNKVLQRSDSPLALKLVQSMLNLGIPFNRKLGFKLNCLSSHKTEMTLPFKRNNKNHLGTTHACAIATLGEFPAGLTLIKNFSPARYRVVLQNLNVEYLKHGIGPLKGLTRFSEEEAKKAREELDSQGVATVESLTIVSDHKGVEVARVSASWQLKEWELIRRSSRA